MTMIIAAHLGDCILIAADKRAMTCNLETGAMEVHSDQEQKIQLWNRGSVAGTGDTVFVNHVAQYFVDHQDGEPFKQMDAINEALRQRILEGVPLTVLQNNTIFFSMFNGAKTLLYSISTASFFNVFKGNGVDMINPELHEIEEQTINVTCFNIPADITSLQNFQKNMKPLSNFENDTDGIIYHIGLLKEVFATHASIDPSTTTSFDLFVQSCETGKSVAIHVPNYVLSSKIPEKLNYWERIKQNELLENSAQSESI